jgi:nudix-type nucleoside diphosphatase (YffH/AdpP family)
MTYEITGVETLHHGWARYLTATIRLPDGRIMTREIEDHGTAVGVLPYDAGRKTAILVRQFRAPVMYATQQRDFLEAIAGTVEEPDPAEAAKREAHEEAGLQLTTLEPVGTVWAMPGISTERMSLYLAPYTQASRVGDGGGLDHEHERITVVEMPLAELAAMADAGALADMKTMLLVQTLRLRHPGLFGA